MNDTKKPGTFMAAMRHFFGFLPGQTLTEFGLEIKNLSDTDKKYFADHLRAAGYPLPY